MNNSNPYDIYEPIDLEAYPNLYRRKDDSKIHFVIFNNKIPVIDKIIGDIEQDEFDKKKYEELINYAKVPILAMMNK